MITRNLFIIATLLSAPLRPALALAACPGIPAVNADAFARSPTCPADAFALRQGLLADGFTLRTAMVANRGFHNPAQGSFSFFEEAEGPGLGKAELFFGHFTAVDEQGRLGPDQQPSAGALMVELISWDPGKSLYNFYELIGDGQQGHWFYRGDTADIRADLAPLHLRKPSFGARLRCSGCHLGGGPIMKELALPHNDWWEPARKLLFAQPLAPAALEIMKNLVPAESFADAVRAGQAKLAPTGSLREKLRPLFCPMEVNFESDSAPLEANLPTIAVPRAFFADPRLAPGPALEAPRAAYLQALADIQSVFPEDGQSDADHAWLVPVKAATDQALVAHLIKEGLIDDEFVADVLAIDFTNPLASASRCALLPLVPETLAPDWKARFAAALQATPNPAAQELARNLTDPARNAQFHRARAAAFVQSCAETLGSGAALADYLALRAQRAAEIKANAISEDPRGQILEPGFRVIFPDVSPAPAPGRLRLDESCRVGP